MVAREIDVAKVGRNAPCPCGSGKKYKKCCLSKDAARHRRARATDELPRADRRVPAPPTPGPNVEHDELRQAERRQRLLRLVDRLWSMHTRTLKRWARGGRASLLHDVAARYDVDLDLCDAPSVDFLAALTCFGSRVAGDLHAAYRKELRASIRDRRLHQLLGLLERTPLQVWCTHADDSGRILEGHPFVGPDSRRVRLLNAVDWFGRSLPEGVYTGWPLPFDGGRYLLFALPVLSGMGVALRQAAERLDHGDFHTFWNGLQLDAVASVVDYLDPDELERDVDVSGTPTQSGYPLDVDGLRRHLLWKLEKAINLPLRIDIARAWTPADMGPTLIRVGAVRDDFLRLLTPVIGKDFEALLPLASLLTYYGAQPDGSMTSERLDKSGRMPVAILGLEPTILERAGLDPLLDVTKAVAWADSSPDHPSAAPLRQATQGYVSEQRWLATFDASRKEHPQRPDWSYYDDLMQGFKCLFEADFLEVSLAEIGVSPGSLSRLRKAARQWLAEEDLDAVGDLPMTVDRLFELQGVGRKTIDELSGAVFEHAGAWRRARIPVDDVRLEALLQASAAPDGDLRDGLDELASLFGG